MTAITRRAALGGMASLSAVGGAGAALASSPAAMSFDDVESRIDELASEISDLLPDIALNQSAGNGWYVRVYANCWCYTRMPWRGHDPILDALEAYREGMEAYERHPILNKVNSTAEENEAAVAATYGPALAVLHAWEQPAITRSGAIAALRYALDEGAGDVGDGVGAMIAAALSYLESGSSS